jgi:hypothetical protein
MLADCADSEAARLAFIKNHWRGGEYLTFIRLVCTRSAAG